MNDTVESIRQTLAGLAYPEGGWAYAAGKLSQLEPTCLALLALSQRRDQYRDAIDRGLAFVRQCAGPDGAYRLAAGRTEAVWPTALVLFVQSALELPRDQIDCTAARLLATRGELVSLPAAEVAAVHDIDINIIGWPWAEGTFSWVEPTCWACLALRRAGQGNHPRVQEGIRMLLDRAFEEGGINYGNRKILGRSTEPVLGTTVMMLLALQGRPADKRVAAAVEYLRREVAPMEDVENVSWVRLALDASGVPADELATLDGKIERSRKTRAELPWVKPSPLREALAALALSCRERNVFRLPEQPAGKDLAPATVIKPKRGLKERFHSAFQGVVVRAVGALRPVAPEASVHVAKVGSYNADLADVLTRQYENYRERVPLKGRRVVIKPNLVEFRPNKVINTDPHVVGGVIELCKREGASEVVVAEGPGHWRNVEHMVAASGLGEVLKHHGVAFVDLNHDDPARVVNLGRCTGMEHLWLARTVQQAEVLISVAKLKTHHWAGATLSLKNLFGIMPGTCYGWPKNELHWRGIDNSIVDIALTRTPDLAVVDGIIGMEGDGPLNGTPKELGALIMGVDPLAVDATCCRLMKLDPAKLPYLLLGHQRKLGLLAEAQIKQIGETIAALAQPFETVPSFHELYTDRSA